MAAITDQAGNWKQYASHAFGKLVTVIEPDPHYNPTAPSPFRHYPATHPERGTVSYSYNADGMMSRKTDANGNPKSYPYDAYQRLTAIPDRQQTFAYDICATARQNVPVRCVSAAGQQDCIR